MVAKNRFYIGKEQTAGVLPDCAYDLSTGIEVTQSGSSIIVKENTYGSSKITIKGELHHSQVTVLIWNQSNSYEGYEVLSSTLSEELDFVYEIPENTKYIAFMFDGTTISNRTTVNKKLETRIFPHYKQIKKKYKKENGQVFFRESLDGKINLWGDDYELINNASLEDELLFTIYKNGSIYASASFNKSDCKFDHFRKAVQIGLKYNDRYSKILDAYDNTYDLIKLAPAITPLTLTKRCVTQIYIQGENVVSNYAGGTYWETEVEEQVNDPNLLTNKYYFAKGSKYVEVDLEGFNVDINASYMGLWNSNVWNSVSYVIVGGVKQRVPCSIKFTKVLNKNDHVPAGIGNIYLLSTGTGDGTYSDIYDIVHCSYDSYRIEIYSDINGAGRKLYQSNYLYGKDIDIFTLANGEGLYPMAKISQPFPYVDPTPANFNLGENVIEYQIWGRLLCDVDSVTINGATFNLYDLPRDDFATPRRNYRKCVGLIGFDEESSVVQIRQSQQTSEEPTSYGINDFREYFEAPYTTYQQYYHPLSRSAWANTSMWVELFEVTYPYGGYEVFCRKYYKEYTLKNAYHIGDIIKTLLAEIDPTITHEKTSEYSQFLYGHSGATASALGNCDIYITQKTNILKGEYDQAAQKAEIKFKQLMEMLRDCFRCYWYIDEQNRFRIEHISYFMNGLSYNSPTVQLDLTVKSDKFNKKPALYAQREIEFDKADLASRYEFAWMDDTTKAIGGDLWVNIKNKYIQKDKTEEINVDGFVSDIDYMLFLPDDFSNDGFALIMADADKKVPIVRQNIKEEMQHNRSNIIDVQNWYASFNQLIWHYMEDMPGNIIENNNISSLQVGNIKRSMKYDIEFPSNGLEIDLYKLITTEEGNGYIEELSTNIDTDLSEIELRYVPR